MQPEEKKATAPEKEETPRRHRRRSQAEKKEKREKKPSLFSRAPIFLLVLASGVLFEGASLYGSTRAYEGRTWNPVTEPYFTAVLENLSDGVLPWSEKKESLGMQEALAMIEQAEAARKAAEKEAEPPAADGSGTEGAEEAAPKEKAGEPAGEEQAEPAEPSGEETPAEPSEEQTSEETGAEDISAEETSAEEPAGDASSEEEPPAEEAQEPAPEPEPEPAPEPDLNVPEWAGSPVVDAEDYGNTRTSYLMPEGLDMKALADGIFAPNGTYYPLQKVDDRYFADALFIGDSRTEGLCIYTSMRGLTTFAAKESVNVFNIYDRTLDWYKLDGSMHTCKVRDALAEKQFRKVYVSVGINELGMTALDYYNNYKLFIQVVRSYQPDAIIYIQGIMHVTESYARRNNLYNNTNIVNRNRALKSLANGRDIIYIDMNSSVCLENGCIPEDISFDGVHLKAGAYETWHQFLLENAVVRNEEDWAPLPEEPAETSGEASTEEAAGEPAAEGAEAPAAEAPAEETAPEAQTPPAEGAEGQESAASEPPAEG